MKRPQLTIPQETKTTPTEVVGWAQSLVRLHARIASRFARPEPLRRALAYLQGLLSCVERKNGWHLAEHAREANPYGMQRLLSQAVWDEDLVRDDLRTFVIEHLGDLNAILALDETSFPKRGRKSAGVKKQYCGTTGDLENCQVGVFLSYVTAKGHTLIDRELYLPLKWIQDRERCQEADIPVTVRFQTKCELARQMIERIHHAHIPISWVVADTVYGSNQALRTWLQANQYSYVLAVACDEPIGIQTPDGRKLVEVRDVEALLLHAQDWQRLSMSQGTKGPRIFDWTAVPILHQWEDDGQHWLLMRRCVDDPSKKTYYLVFAPQGTTLQEMVEAIGARWYIEQDFETSKDMGLDQYEVRSWTGWYRHVTLVMLAHANFPTICSQDKAPAYATSSTLSTLDTSSTLPALGVAPLTVVSRASSAWTSHLAASLQYDAASFLVVVATMPSQSCQLLPHEASSESWITACPADRYQHLSDTGNLQDLSCTDARPSSCVCSFLQRRSHDHNLSFYHLLPDAWGGAQDLAALAVDYPDGANWTRDRQPPQAPHA